MSTYKEQSEQKRKDWKWVKISFSALFIILILIFSKLWYDGILFFSTEAAIVEAYVEQVAYTPERHDGWYRTVHYSYHFNDSTYSGMEKISFATYFCKPGDTLDIEVLKRKPNISRLMVYE